MPADLNILTQGGGKSASDRRSSSTPTQRTPFTGPTVALHRPQIPQNTGNISRLCVALQSPLIVTGRAGFNFDAAAVKRAGLDHWEHLDFMHFARFKDFWKKHANRRIIGVTKVAPVSALAFDYAEGDILLFGNETMGLPPALLNRLKYTVNLPMSGKVRSLNLANSVAVAAYAYVAKVHPHAGHNADTYPRTYYRSLKK